VDWLVRVNRDSELKREFDRISSIPLAQGYGHSVGIVGFRKQVRTPDPYDRPSQEIPVVVCVDVYSRPADVSCQEIRGNADGPAMAYL